MGYSIVMELVNMFIHGNMLINFKGRIGRLSHCPCLELLSLAEPGRCSCQQPGRGHLSTLSSG